MWRLFCRNRRQAIWYNGADLAGDGGLTTFAGTQADTMEDFEQRLRSAIDMLYERDAFLLNRKNNLNERSVSFRFAMYLAEQFPEWGVDCEYNRMVRPNGEYTEGDYWAKTVNIEYEGHIGSEDDEAKTVYPDIIIHQRGTRDNLAIIEIKMQWKNSKKDFDFKKLQAYKSDLQYEYCVYIEFTQERNSLKIQFV